MTTITGKINVYLSSYSALSMDDYDKTEDVSKFLFFEDMGPDYALVGKAEISITFNPRAVVVANKVESLRAELQQVRAAAQIKANEIEGQIQNLLAIEHEVAS